MKIGDLVKHKYGTVIGHGIIIGVDDSHRQTTAAVLFHTGDVIKLWENHVEVIS